MKKNIFSSNKKSWTGKIIIGLIIILVLGYYYLNSEQKIPIGKEKISKEESVSNQFTLVCELINSKAFEEYPVVLFTVRGNIPKGAKVTFDYIDKKKTYETFNENTSWLRHYRSKSRFFDSNDLKKQIIVTVDSSPIRVDESCKGIILKQ